MRAIAARDGLELWHLPVDHLHRLVAIVDHQETRHRYSSPAVLFQRARQLVEGRLQRQDAVDVALRACRDGAGQRLFEAPDRAAAVRFAARPVGPQRAPESLGGGGGAFVVDEMGDELARRRRSTEVAAIARRPDQPLEQIVPDAGQPAVVSTLSII